MKRNFLKISLFLIGVFTCFSCEASTTYSSSSSDGVGESMPTAQQWNKDVVGWNLGNEFECSAPGQDGESMQIGNPDGSIHAETAWGNPVVTKKMIQAVKKAGFNAIRIPIRWQCHITNAQAMSIDKAWIARIKEVVGWCLDNGLKVIINVHHEKWLESRPTYQYKEENCQKLALLWMNIASEFANYDSRLAFAGTNEVHIRDNWGKPTAENLEVQNAYNQIFVDMVRATGGNNAKRHLILQTYVCNPWFGIENGDFIIPKDAEGNGNNYMSVEFHYYQPWSYAGDCTYDYWGDAYKDAGKIPADNEKTMTDFFDKAVNTWSNKGLGIVIGEWGVTDHYKSNSEKVHENMTYYCKFLTTEARKRGFSTFVWDNNHFGNGSEKYGIFDRFKSMKVNAPWILEGIFNNVKLKTKISIMRKKTMFLGLLGAGLMWMPASAILAAQMNNAAMSVQQNQGIKGTVVDATGETLIGASVKVAGTTNGAVTDIDGNFTLNCKPGVTLEVSYIGYKTMTVKAANGMKITMQEDGKALNEVVVTALGIKRDRKALGYGLEEVKGEELTKAKETNVINSLSGKVAGLVVQNTAGGASGSTRVLLRGNTEMSGNNPSVMVSLPSILTTSRR